MKEVEEAPVFELLPAPVLVECPEREEEVEEGRALVPEQVGEAGGEQTRRFHVRDDRKQV